MPWKETCAMDEKRAFIEAWLSGEFSVSELCRRFGVSRVTGYRWIERFKRYGMVGLEARSSAAHWHPNATEPALVQTIVELKHRHPSWGPLKLRMYAQRQQPQVGWPAASTFGEILKRHDLVVARRRRARTAQYGEPFSSVQAANDVWSIDFKGQFVLGDGRLCYPLTISDNFSRYLLRCQALSRPCHAPVQAALEKLFRQLRAAARHPQRQRCAVCECCGRRTEPAGGVADQARCETRAHCARPAAAKWPARAHASDAEG
jgi:putative transposase